MYFSLTVKMVESVLDLTSASVLSDSLVLFASLPMRDIHNVPTLNML